MVGARKSAVMQPYDGQAGANVGESEGLFEEQSKRRGVREALHPSNLNRKCRASCRSERWAQSQELFKVF